MRKRKTNKKILAALAVAAVCLLLCGCDPSQAYEEMVGRLRLPETIQNAGQPQIPDGGGTQNPDGETQPQQPDGPEQSAAFPDQLPAPEYHSLVFERWEEDGFRAEYLMSAQQLESWKDALLAAGFSGQEPMSNGEWTLSVSANPDKSGTAEYRVTVALSRPSEPSWPQELAAFPVFEGEGRRTVEIEREGELVSALMVSEGESTQAYNDYLTLLKQSGFQDQGYGLYVKREADCALEVETDGAWQQQTLTLRFYLRPSR